MCTACVTGPAQANYTHQPQGQLPSLARNGHCQAPVHYFYHIASFIAHIIIGPALIFNFHSFGPTSLHYHIILSPRSCSHINAHVVSMQFSNLNMTSLLNYHILAIVINSFLNHHKSASQNIKVINNPIISFIYQHFQNHNNIINHISSNIKSIK